MRGRMRDKARSREIRGERERGRVRSEKQKRRERWDIEGQRRG